MTRNQIRFTELGKLIKSYAKATHLVFRFGLRRTIRFAFDSIKQQIEIQFVVTPNRDQLMGVKGDATWELMKRGAISEPHFKELLRAIRHQETIGIALDLGANHGSHILEMIRTFPSLKIFSFEANPIIFSLLNFNCKNETNIRTHPFAVGNTTGELISMEAIDTRGRTNSGTYGVSSKNFPINQCITLKIDDYPLERLDFVKMDVQGSELKALIGMRNTLEKFMPIIFLEIEECHLLKNGASSAEVIRFIHTLGYQIYRIENDYPVDHIALPSSKKSLLQELNLNLREIPHGFKKLLFDNDKYYSHVN